MSLVVLVGASGNLSGQQCSFASSPALASKPVGSVLEVPTTSADQNPNEPYIYRSQMGRRISDWSFRRMRPNARQATCSLP